MSSGETFITTAAVRRDRERLAQPSPSRRTVTVTDYGELAPDVIRLTIHDPFTAEHGRPGQFVNLYPRNPLHMMPRPLGICEINSGNGTVTFVFAIVGVGTADLATLRPGDEVDMLGPLGRGYDLSGPAHYLLVGGGLGVPPLISAAQQLHSRQDCTTSVVFGYHDRHHFADALAAPYADEVLSIDDPQGTVVTLLDREEEHLLTGNVPAVHTVVLCCGSSPMLHAVARWTAERGIPTQFSLEARMGCGYGACWVCVVDTRDGRQKVCLDGPVFTLDQLGWDGDRQ